MIRTATVKQRHAHMVDDMLRTGPLLRAIAELVKPGDTVIDIGTGLGGLAIAAAKAGALHVLAIDCDEEALARASKNAKRAGVANCISFTHILSFDLKIKKRVDAILCETVGSFAFDENILATLSDAKRRLLKSGGLIVPARLELWGAPCIIFPRIKEPSEIASVKKKDLLTLPSRIAVVDFTKFIPASVHVKHQFKITTEGTVHSIAVWPFIAWGGLETTDASPLLPSTHWKQGILPIEERSVKSGERLSLELAIRPHPQDPRRMTERLWRWM